MVLYMFGEMLQESLRHVITSPRVHQSKKKEKRLRSTPIAADDLMHHLQRLVVFYLVSDTAMSSSVSGANANWLTTQSFSTLTHTGPVFGSLSIFLCSSASLSPLPLVFRAQPTLSVGWRDRRCLANAPAGSVLVLVSVFTCNCKSSNKWPLWKRQPDLSTSLAHGGMSGELDTLYLNSWS